MESVIKKVKELGEKRVDDSNMANSLVSYVGFSPQSKLLSSSYRPSLLSSLIIIASDGNLSKAFSQPIMLITNMYSP